MKEYKSFFSKDNLERLRLQEYEKFRGVTSGEAKKRLEDWGYDSEKWETILTSGDRSLGSHDVRLLILIAQGVDIFERPSPRTQI